METDDFFLKENKKMVKIALNEILYIESFKDYMCFHCIQKSVKVRIPLWSVEERLDKKQFVRVHKSFIVAIKHIESFSSAFIEVNNHKIPIGSDLPKRAFCYLTNSF
jgi:DNA-binding LytR/AlgR family response regulator